MWLRIVSLVVLGLVVSAKTVSSNHELKWPEKYSLEISQVSLTSGVVKDIKVWRTAKRSRIEYNKGAVLKFVINSKGTNSSKYEVHPETEGDEINKMTCHLLEKSKFDDDGPQDILPDVEDYERDEEVKMKDMDCVKFLKKQEEDNVFKKETLWAAYIDKNKAWIPVRYEVFEYNSWHGSNDKHELWDFESYKSKFNEKKIFDIDEYCSGIEPVEHKISDESVTKHLLFMDPEKEHHVDHVFTAFKKNFKRNYTHEDEHTMRKTIFKRNMRLVASTNMKHLGYKLSINHFADRTPEEIRRSMGHIRGQEGRFGTEPFPYNESKVNKLASQLPAEYDLRLLGLISPVKKQEECGSCWTFGSTAAAEGALAASNGKLMRLSNQALIDCAWEFGGSGCDGGTDTAAFQWMLKYGLPTEEEYGTYADADGFCLIKNMNKTYPIRGFVDVTPNSIGALKVAVVKHGPLSVSVNVPESFLLYSGGVYYGFDCSSDPDELNHEIALVGYGDANGETFWIVKNSWGQEWGIDGYMHISARNYNCGVMTEPTYVIF